MNDLASKFWERVEYVPFHECWEWVGKATKAGYGQFYTHNRVIVYAHRFSYELANGPIPKGKLVRHTCDNPSCVRPEHLEVGTDVDNVEDMVKRGRQHWIKQTHCKWGHEFTSENTYLYPGRRECIQCRARRRANHQRKKKNV